MKEKLLRRAIREEIKKLNEYQIDVSDDLKSNYREWEYDHDNFDDTMDLANQLSSRHHLDSDEAFEVAADWTGFERKTVVKKPSKARIPQFVIDKVIKLRKSGLSDEEISEKLHIRLSVIQKVEE